MKKLLWVLCAALVLSCSAFPQKPTATPDPLRLQAEEAIAKLKDQMKTKYLEFPSGQKRSCYEVVGEDAWSRVSATPLGKLFPVAGREFPQHWAIETGIWVWIVSQDGSVWWSYHLGYNPEHHGHLEFGGANYLWRNSNHVYMLNQYCGRHF